MSRIISYRTVDKTSVLAYLPAGDLTPDQRRILGLIRERAQRAQDDLDHQGLDWGLTIPEALDHLLAGRADSDASYAAGAYARALQTIISSHGSDPSDLGVYSKPATFFSALDDELRRLGVSADLLMYDHLFFGWDEMPFHLPYPVDGPNIGVLPLAKAKPIADAYRAVLDQMDQDFHYDVRQLIEMLEFEHEEWEKCRKNGWYTPDSIFFSITG
ncbi:hypothetical protein F7Q99_31050 [Streptomyces kaniharaensis]|uniref:DUF7691 domain-containing protein n=1 Tax=Streptomyces kaniharaensis TaxID=212423 RepID=A0A6N7KY02_9ACTN|nr:hypothetical protein [Streptomyces kaniharaensis]MQS16512.1 hypothetical protein [Streptomyces kaniharaensis]